MNEKQEWERFQHWYSEEGKYQRAIKRNSSCAYILAHAALCWGVWQARAALDQSEEALDMVGKTVSMDVSTGDSDAGHRIFGKVEGIQDGTIIATETSRNFKSASRSRNPQSTD